MGLLLSPTLSATPIHYLSAYGARPIFLSKVLSVGEDPTNEFFIKLPRQKIKNSFAWSFEYVRCLTQTSPYKALLNLFLVQGLL